MIRFDMGWERRKGQQNGQVNDTGGHGVRWHPLRCVSPRDVLCSFTLLLLSAYFLSQGRYVSVSPWD